MPESSESRRLANGANTKSTSLYYLRLELEAKSGGVEVVHVVVTGTTKVVQAIDRWLPQILRAAAIVKPRTLGRLGDEFFREYCMNRHTHTHTHTSVNTRQ